MRRGLSYRLGKSIRFSMAREIAYPKKIPATSYWDNLEYDRERSFITFAGVQESTVEFKIKNGLQQGTVNSSVSFNIFTSDVQKLFGATSDYPIQSIAFADDLVIYQKDSWPSRIRDKLQDVFERIHTYYRSWKLKINTHKCETILFRSNLTYANKNIRRNYKKICHKRE